MIYLDYNATTPVDKKVAEAMLPFIYGEYGNPSSSHELGFSAKMAIEQSRSRVADLLNCSPEEVLFTLPATRVRRQFPRYWRPCSGTFRGTRIRRKMLRRVYIKKTVEPLK